MKAVIGAVMLAAATGSAAQARGIDAYSLPSGGAERAYACTSYLNAHSAIMRLADPKDDKTQAILALYVVMANESQRLGTQAGASAEQVNARMSEWDSAVVEAALSDTSDKEAAFQRNALACVQMGMDQLRKDSPAPDKQTT